MTTNKLTKITSLLASKEFKAFLAIPSDVRGRLVEYRQLERAAISCAIEYFKGTWGRDQRKDAKAALSAIPELASIAARIVAGLFPSKPAKLDRAGQAKLAGVLSAMASAVSCFPPDELPAVRSWLNLAVSKLMKSAAEKAEKASEK